MTTSIWQRSRTAIDHDVEVVVIGGGIVGVSAALELGRRGIRTVLLERREIASGASGRNAGYLMRGVAESYAVAADQYGRREAGELWRWTEANLEALRVEGIGSLDRYSARPSTLVAFESDEAEDLRRSGAMLLEDGFDVDVLTTAPTHADSLWATGNVRCALRNPADAVCSPVEVVEWLAAKLGPTVSVLEHTEVVDISEHAGGVTIETSRGSVSSNQAMLCTNAWTGEVLPSLAGAVEPKRAQMIRVLAPGASLNDAYYANRGNEYFRAIGMGDFIFGGWRRAEPADQAHLTDGVCNEVQHRLVDLAHVVLGRDVEICERWGGAMAFTQRHVPVVGRCGGGVWICAGFTGHGMSMGFMTARAAVRSMLGDPDVSLPSAIITASNDVLKTAP